MIRSSLSRRLANRPTELAPQVLVEILERLAEADQQNAPPGLSAPLMHQWLLQSQQTKGYESLARSLTAHGPARSAPPGPARGGDNGAGDEEGSAAPDRLPGAILDWLNRDDWSESDRKLLSNAVAANERVYAYLDRLVPEGSVGKQRVAQARQSDFGHLAGLSGYRRSSLFDELDIPSVEGVLSARMGNRYHPYSSLSPRLHEDVLRDEMATMNRKIAATAGLGALVLGGIGYGLLWFFDRLDILEDRLVEGVMLAVGLIIVVWVTNAFTDRT